MVAAVGIWAVGVVVNNWVLGFGRFTNALVESGSCCKDGPGGPGLFGWFASPVGFAVVSPAAPLLVGSVVWVTSGVAELLVCAGGATTLVSAPTVLEMAPMVACAQLPPVAGVLPAVGC